MGRAASVDKNGLKKGPWSQEEDEKLRAYVLRYGHWNWRQLPRFAGLSRCGKSCRLRWMNYLRPGVRRGNFSREENDLIIQLHKQLGNKWSRIAAKLPGRTDNEIKNHWHTHLQKLAKQHPTACEVKDQCTVSETSQTVVSQNQTSEAQSIVVNSPSNATSGAFSTLTNSTNYYGMEDSRTSKEIVQGSGEDFWTQPFITDNAYNQPSYILSSSVNHNVLDYGINSSMEVQEESSGDFWAQPFVLDNINVYNQDDYDPAFFTDIEGYISLLSYA